MIMSGWLIRWAGWGATKAVQMGFIVFANGFISSDNEKLAHLRRFFAWCAKTFRGHAKISRVVREDSSRGTRRFFAWYVKNLHVVREDFSCGTRRLFTWHAKILRVVREDSLRGM